ncbi:N-acetylmannosamine-6-phosphate 2-epimerase [Heyndrickxia oleronia]|uniref:N-acetylmannosamine-6-phosphate 2-epimerase n=1 Tax=Heyndrickxia oleronia TaxID=38875 RepID=UPI00203DF262|nr:N-acetylmannosamine-6-phosphate 2-epimerase [Heyndrickxia oleronia]MCM3238546.1 N-acetylmannosamine-6-phosphate 2-epimerase [Heyndrickxia oleronia]
MEKQTFLNLIKGKLIVSCQALEDEPLHGSEYMAKMGLAAKIGGAVAIRANGKEDIIAIKKLTGLPTIGIIKRNYKGSEIFITPTLKEVEELIESGADVITLDATARMRPNGITLHEMITFIRENSNSLVMADVSTVEEGVVAVEEGCDLISTTLSGYTSYSPKLDGPDFSLIKKLTSSFDVPVIAEGRISTPEEAVMAFKQGAHSVVVGTAITRPQVLTKRFVESLEKNSPNIMS